MKLWILRKLKPWLSPWLESDMLEEIYSRLGYYEALAREIQKNNKYNQKKTYVHRKKR